MHMVEVGSDFWREHLLFRDYLRAHPDVADAYARLKRELAADYNATCSRRSRNINLGYTDHKTDFVESREGEGAGRGAERTHRYAAVVSESPSRPAALSSSCDGISGSQ